MAEKSQFDVLAHVVEIANSSVDVTERLDGILGVICSHLDARLAALFMQEQRNSQLVSANVWPGEARPAQPLRVEFGQGKVGQTALTREPLQLEARLPTGDPGLDALCREGEWVCLFPVMDDNRLYAVLLLAYGAQGQLKDEHMRLMQMVVREMAGSIRNFRLYFEAKRRIAELNVLSDLGRAAVSTIEIDELLNIVAGICAKLLGARGGLVKISASNGEPMILKAAHGQVPPACEQEVLCGAEQGGQASGQAGICQCEEQDQQGQAVRALCAPLTFKSRSQGQLCVFDKMIEGGASGRGFNDDDRNLLVTMASMVSAALDNALTFQRVEDLAQRNEEMVGALATLYEISTVLMTTMDLAETVQILLHAVTHPAGLDHDRVMILLAEEDGQLRLVADMTKETNGGQLKELTQSLLEIKEHDAELPGVNEDLANLHMNIKQGRGFIAKTLEAGRPIRVDDPAHDPGVDPKLLAALGEHPFVCVPMFSKGTPVGVMLVNNFLSKRFINDRDLKLLAMLANQGGLSVEASRLYQHLDSANREMALMRNRLLEADKLAALGEVAAGVAHEIRNPLVSIGGFTRRIRKKVGTDSSITPYLDVIIEEVTRLERTLNEMLDFSTDTREHFEERDLDLIMDQALELLKREIGEYKIKVKKKYAEVPKVYCDERQIKHVFLNLLLNAIQAMAQEGGTLTMRTFSVVREGMSFVAGEVADTGGGIPINVIHNIFNPFFTTKDSGSGLGLSIVHKIVTRHFGQVEVHNREGEGATFLVILPAAEEGRAYLK